jgi:hypothetical protein
MRDEMKESNMTATARTALSNPMAPFAATTKVLVIFIITTLRRRSRQLKSNSSRRMRM